MSHCNVMDLCGTGASDLRFGSSVFTNNIISQVLVKNILEPSNNFNVGIKIVENV